MSFDNIFDDCLYEAKRDKNALNTPSEALIIVNTVQSFCDKLRFIASSGSVSIQGAPIIMEQEDINSMRKILDLLEYNRNKV
jgi:hypothetical protein